MPGKLKHWSRRYFTAFKRNDKDAARCNFCSAEYLVNTPKMEHPDLFKVDRRHILETIEEEDELSDASDGELSSKMIGNWLVISCR